MLPVLWRSAAHCWHRGWQSGEGKGARRKQMMEAPRLITTPKGRWNCNYHRCSTDSLSAQRQYLAVEQKWGICTNYVSEVFSKWPGSAQQLSFHPFPIEWPSSSRAACDNACEGYTVNCQTQETISPILSPFPQELRELEDSMLPLPHASELCSVLSQIWSSRGSIPVSGCIGTGDWS